MADLGTYGSTIYPYTPENVVPLPGDIITLDWMEGVSQWTQRFMKMATFEVSSLANGGSYGFSYRNLRCDKLPYYQSYFWDTTDSCWKEWGESFIQSLDPADYQKWCRFGSLTTNGGTFVNQTGAARKFLILVYL